MMGELSRLTAVATLSFRGSLRGLRTIGLAVFAAIPSFLVLALVSASISGETLANAAETLVGVLAFPIVGMVIVLMIAVAQFRNEIDNETLVYLSDRSAARPTLVLGKYLGAWGASLVLVLPAALVPLGISTVAGGTPYAANVPVVLAVTVLLASAVYVAFFLFLGLVSRSALIIGLLFGFLWEELLLTLPGEAPRLTLVYYLNSFLSGELTTGPLSGYPTVVPVPLAVAVLVSVTVFFLVLAALAFRYLETAPDRASA